MGLQSQLNDVSSGSIPLLLLALFASFFSHVRSLLLSLFRFSQDDAVLDDSLFGSGLGGLVLLSEQLNLNRALSHRFPQEDDVRGIDCVVCLCTLRDGDQVRKLACRHVFHKACFDGWLDHLNFSCPLCRSPLVSPERVALAERRVAGDLAAWFSWR